MTGQQRKQRGQDRVERNNQRIVKLLRDSAEAQIAQSLVVTSDDMRELAARLGLPKLNPHVWGCLFRDKRFVCVDRMPSRIPSNHARYINVYTLKRRVTSSTPNTLGRLPTSHSVVGRV